MAFVIYNTLSTKILDHTGKPNCHKTYATERAAKAARTKACKVLDIDADIGVSDYETFLTTIELKETRYNAMSGEEFETGVNASFATCPSSENYWQS